MRIRQMGFSSRLKAHKNILTLETLKFIAEYLIDGNARLAALRSGIPETYAARHGQCAALENELDPRELRQLQKAIGEIDSQMQICKNILGLDDV
jgi:phage terminase small subunit